MTVAVSAAPMTKVLLMVFLVVSPMVRGSGFRFTGRQFNLDFLIILYSELFVCQIDFKLFFDFF